MVDSSVTPDSWLVEQNNQITTTHVCVLDSLSFFLFLSLSLSHTHIHIQLGKKDFRVQIKQNQTIEKTKKEEEAEIIVSELPFLSPTQNLVPTHQRLSHHVEGEEAGLLGDAELFVSSGGGAYPLPSDVTTTTRSASKTTPTTTTASSHDPKEKVGEEEGRAAEEGRKEPTTERVCVGEDEKSIPCLSSSEIRVRFFSFLFLLLLFSQNLSDKLQKSIAAIARAIAHLRSYPIDLEFALTTRSKSRWRRRHRSEEEEKETEEKREVWVLQARAVTHTHKGNRIEETDTQLQQKEKEEEEKEKEEEEEEEEEQIYTLHNISEMLGGGEFSFCLFFLSLSLFHSSLYSCVSSVCVFVWSFFVSCFQTNIHLFSSLFSSPFFSFSCICWFVFSLSILTLHSHPLSFLESFFSHFFLNLSSLYFFASNILGGDKQQIGVYASKKRRERRWKTTN